jgi:DNA repair protein RadC
MLAGNEEGPGPRRGARSDRDGGGSPALAALRAVIEGPRAPLAEARWRAVRGAVELFGLATLAAFSAEELAAQCGLSRGQARRLRAAFEVGRQVEGARVPERVELARPGAVALLLAPDFRGLEVEVFRVLVLDARHRLKGRFEVSRGTLTSAPVHPREVFGPALRLAGAAIIVAHNHPSGDPEPSPSDIEVTARLRDAGRLLGVPLLDHVVWAEGAYTSLRERGHWPR